MKTAIITGANGFIGSHLVFRLLTLGWRVQALGRGTSSRTWKDRLVEAVKEVGSVEAFVDQLEYHEWDLSPDNPIPPCVLETDASSTILFHVAGDTRFKPSDPQAQRRINVQAPIILASALRGRIERMVHVSTAYVAGRRTGLILESDLVAEHGFWNSYELSKFDAEVELTRFCGQAALPLVIVRPSIIINDRNSGRASTFTHLNALVEVVSRLQTYYGLSDGQVVSKSIRLLANPQARPNLAPVDSIVPPLIRIAESPAAPGKTFHLSHPQPQTNAQIMTLICQAYRVQDLLALEFVERFSTRMSHTEEMVSRALKVYSPYLNSEQTFDLSNSRFLVPDYDSYFSPLDLTYLRKVIDFQRRQRTEQSK